MTHKDLADLIFPNITKTIEDYEKMYPERNLPEGALVTRYAPSPTGFNHIGGVMQAMISQTIAKQTGGVSIVRIEDTDTKREVSGSADALAKAFQKYGIFADEGMISEEKAVSMIDPRNLDTLLHPQFDAEEVKKARFVALSIQAT